MNLTFAILLWMIGQKLGMDYGYYLMIVVGFCFHILRLVLRRADDSLIEDSDLRG